MNHKSNIDLWIEYVCCEWLNKWEPSHLRSSIARLINRMRSAVGCPENFDAAWALVDEIEKLHAVLPDDTHNHVKESPQMLLECALAAHKMGNSREAIRLLNGAITHYTDPHENAVARWLLGCVYWHVNEPVNALSAWEKSLNDFKDLEQRTEKYTQVTRWYHEKVMEMDDAIKYAADDNIAPPVGWVPSRPEAPEGGTRHLIQSLPIIGSIPAGQPFNLLPDPLDFMEIHQVTLEKHKYRIVSLLRGKKVVNLPVGQRFYILRVSGHSMNQCWPEPIEDGDYVIVREQHTSDPNDIVAALIIEDQGEGEGRATLKRYVVKDGKVYLQPESSDPEFQKPVYSRTFDKLEGEFEIRGVAVGVLKPL